MRVKGTWTRFASVNWRIDLQVYSLSHGNIPNKIICKWMNRWMGSVAFIYQSSFSRSSHRYSADGVEANKWRSSGVCCSRRYERTKQIVGSIFLSWVVAKRPSNRWPETEKFLGFVNLIQLYCVFIVCYFVRTGTSFSKLSSSVWPHLSGTQPSRGENERRHHDTREGTGESAGGRGCCSW